MKLEQAFETILTKYNVEISAIKRSWKELIQRHAEPHRYYHTLVHLEQVYTELEPLQPHIRNWNAVVLSIAWHDSIYDVQSSENEELSAELAVNQLNDWNVPQFLIQKVNDFILATKSHHISEDNDCNLFTDADLAILGKSEEVYAVYASAIRQEYSVYPDELYNPGRAKVLQHFLKMPRIYKTEYFFNRYENGARLNILAEYNRLIKTPI